MTKNSRKSADSLVNAINLSLHAELIAQGYPPERAKQVKCYALFSNQPGAAVNISLSDPQDA